MKKIYLELTNRCNLNCIMCYRKSWHEHMVDMDKTVLDKCIKEIKGNEEIQEVVLGGIGEPLYSREILYVIESLKDKKLLITTNGTIMTGDIISSIVANVDEVVISVDGMEENFEAIRDFSLKTILNNVKALVEEKKKHKSQTPKIAFQMVITKDNYQEMTDVVLLADEYQVDKVIFSNVVPATMEDNNLVMYEKYSKEPLEKPLQKAIVKALVKKIELVIPEIMLKTERRCRFIDEESMMVTVDGRIVPCYRFAHDGREVVFGREKEIRAHYFGDVSNETLQDIWDKEEYYNYRMTVYNNQYPSCMDCDLVDGCDMVKYAEVDCYGNTPSCADCLWSRKIVYCI